MNLKQINLFREIIMYYQASDISRSSKLDVEYAKAILDDLENRIPTDRQLELQSNIITKYITPEMIEDMQKEIRLKINEWSKVDKQISEIWKDTDMRFHEDPYVSLNKLQDEIKYYIHVLDTILTNGHHLSSHYNMNSVSLFQSKYPSYKESKNANH